jgi:hypothetical protein
MNDFCGFYYTFMNDFCWECYIFMNDFLSYNKIQGEILKIIIDNSIKKQEPWFHDSCFLVFTTGTLCRSTAAGDLQGNPIYSEAVCSVRYRTSLPCAS